MRLRIRKDQPTVNVKPGREMNVQVYRADRKIFRSDRSRPTFQSLLRTGSNSNLQSEVNSNHG